MELQVITNPWPVRDMGKFAAWLMHMDRQKFAMYAQMIAAYQRRLSGMEKLSG